ncbi:MAG TPA: sialidase family protein [Actinomycetota bacterium]|nr:sialidase family protein [Actinomycetota bacterium]
MKVRRSFKAVACVAALAAFTAGALSAVPAGAAKSDGDGSGGKAVAHFAGAREVKTAKVRAHAPDAKFHPIGLNGSEPTLGLTDDGSVFYTAFQSNTRIEVVRSSDEGETWDIVSPQFAGARNAQLLSLDPYLFVDKRTDRIFTIDLTVACAYLSYTDDQGESWVTNPLACGRPVNDHQTLFAGPPAVSPTPVYPSVVYYCWNDIASSSCSKSLDGGITFSPTGSPAYPSYQEGTDRGGVAGQSVPGMCGGLHGHGHVGPDGTVYIPRGWCGQPWLALSHDEGLTWERVQVANIGIEGHEAGVTTDDKGNIYYTWVGEQDRLPYLAISKDGGTNWSKPMMIGPPGLTESNIPNIDAGAKGKVAIVYMGSENAPGPPFQDPPPCISVLPCRFIPDGYEDVTWNGYITMTDNALSKRPMFYTGSINDKSEPLVLMDCGPGRCQDVLDFIDVVVGPDGIPWGAFVDSNRNDATIVGNGVVGRLVGGPSLR